MGRDVPARRRLRLHRCPEGRRFDGSVGFRKQVSKVSIEKTADGEKTTVEGVKNTTPPIVEGAVGAAVKAAK
jgi:hypothetical protein